MSDTPPPSIGLRTFAGGPAGGSAGSARMARSFPPKKLATRAYSLYEKFQPTVPTGTGGWGAKGDLDLEKLKGLAP